MNEAGFKWKKYASCLKEPESIHEHHVVQELFAPHWV